MADINKEIHKLEQKLFDVTLKQHTLSTEIQQLRDELKRLKYLREEQSEVVVEQVEYASVQVEEQQVAAVAETVEKSTFSPEPKTVFKQEKSNIEKFIGENLISKIGIAITIIGVAIGVKYSIDNQLISPLVRIILGYLLGLGLLGFGIKLKEKYESYSAVLVSGAIAIMYFITYAGYAFYGLIPQALTFVLMLAFTVFAVIAAIHYNRQVIAQIGLVGAYAVPFLLSNNSGQVAVLFTYMSIINVGILVISYKKYWKSLYYSSFVLTWLIYLVWYGFMYGDERFALSLTFLCVFFATFYTVFLLHKLVQKEQYKLFDIVPLLVNSFLFYGIGYAILDSHKTGSELLGLFTLANAVIHFVVSVIIYRQKLVDKNLLYLIIALVFTFITIAIPVQLNGHWITLLWVAQACLLFVIGRIKNVPIFEKISYPLMLLAFISLIMDWDNAYNVYISTLTPVFNIQFLTSMLFVGAFVGINYVHFKINHQRKEGFTNIVNFCLPAVLLVTLYFSIRLEISNYYNILCQNSVIEVTTDGNYTIFDRILLEFKQIWLINYSLIFASLLSIFNIVKIKNKQLGIFSGIFFVLCLLAFLCLGLYSLSELRESYINPNDLPSYYNVTSLWILIRYVSLLFVGFAMYIFYKQLNQSYMPKTKILFDVVLYSSLLWIVSSELIHWLDMAGFTETYKLGLSILWGVYALTIIALGIWKNKKHLRIGGIAVFGVTLIKLFFYDLSNLNTISKTIVLVILGILLLIVSFLYNKYKHLIENE